MNRSLCLAIPAALALCAAGLASASDPAPRVEKDVYGREVRRDGVRVKYSTPPTAEQAAAAQATLAAAERAAAEERGSPGTAASGDLDLQQTWRHVPLGVGLGAAGLFVADIDGDGGAEIVASGGTSSTFGAGNRWYVLKRNGAAYDIAWTSGPLPQLTSLRVQQLDTDPALEVVAAWGNTVSVFDGATKLVERTYAVTGPVLGLEFAQLDGTGPLDLVYVSASGLGILDVETGGVTFWSTAFAGADVALGNVDSDPGLEIVVANGSSTGWVLDGQTRAVKWANSWGFGRHVRIADLGGEGVGEVVAADAWYLIRVFAPASQSLVRTIQTDLDIAALQVPDVDGDGVPEIVYGDGQWGDIHVLGATGAEKWSIPNPEHGVTDIAFGDADADGALEVVWGAGYTSSGSDYLYVHATVAPRALEWRSADIDPPFVGVAWGDVDADGAPELAYVSASAESGYQAGIVFLDDAVTHAREAAIGPLHNVSYSANRTLAAVNLDADPALELVVGVDVGYEGKLRAYDGATRALQWTSPSVGSGLSIAALAAADLDGDGTQELVVATDVEHTGAPGAKVVVFDGATGSLEWASPVLTTGFRSLLDIQVGNLDADAALEIVTRSSEGQLFLLDPVTQAASTLPVSSVAAFAVGDAAKLYLVQSEIVVEYDVASQTVARTVGHVGPGVGTLRLGPAGSELFAAAPDRVLVMGLDGMLLWSGSGFHDVRSITVGDFDGDSATEVWVAMGDEAAVYEVAPSSETDLLVTMEASPSILEVGGNLSVNVQVRNAGRATAHLAELRQTWSPTIELHAVGCNGPSGSAVCSLGDLEPGAAITRTFSGTLGAVTPSIDLATTASSVDHDVAPENNSALAAIAVRPELSTPSVEVVEGAQAVVLVLLSHPAVEPVAVAWTTQPGTALAPSDFVAAAATLDIPVGVTWGSVVVATVNDQVAEPAEAFAVQLTALTGATFATPGQPAAIAIRDNDGPRTLSVAGPASVPEGVGLVPFEIRLSDPSGAVVTVGYKTVDRGAVSGRDYGVLSGTLTFQPGEVRHVVTTSVTQDPFDEDDEAFEVLLQLPVGAALGAKLVRTTIVDDDALPRVEVRGLVTVERTGVPTVVQVPLSLSAPSGRKVTVAWKTANGSAVSGADYEATSGTAVFTPGIRLVYVKVKVINDGVVEPDEAFEIQVTAATNAASAVSLDSVHVLDDDARP